MKVSLHTWGLLPGAPTLTGTGLAPVEKAQRAINLVGPAEASAFIASRRTMHRSYSGSGRHRDCGCSESPAGCSGRSRPGWWPSQYLLPGTRGHESQRLVPALRCLTPREPGEVSGGVVMIRRTLAMRAFKMFALAVFVMAAGT